MVRIAWVGPEPDPCSALTDGVINFELPILALSEWISKAPILCVRVCKNGSSDGAMWTLRRSSTLDPEVVRRRCYHVVVRRRHCDLGSTILGSAIFWAVSLCEPWGGLRSLIPKWGDTAAIVRLCHEDIAILCSAISWAIIWRSLLVGSSG